MTTHENMEIFDRICIALFDKLYSEFPVPVEIDMTSLAMSAIPRNASFEMAWNDLMVSREVVTFLAEEGFLNYSSAPLEEDHLSWQS